MMATLKLLIEVDKLLPGVLDFEVLPRVSQQQAGNKSLILQANLFSSRSSLNIFPFPIC
jgi:hypothetical protein